MDVVLDCSVICGFMFANQRTPYTFHVANALRTRRGGIPSLGIAEISNVLRTQERRGHLQPQASERLLHGLSALALSVEDMTSFQQATTLVALAREYRLSAYDATYLALATRYGIPLATADKALQTAAKALGLFFEEHTP